MKIERLSAEETLNLYLNSKIRSLKEDIIAAMEAYTKQELNIKEVMKNKV